MQETNNTKNKTFYDATRQYTYYIIIGIVSLISVVFLPMVGSEMGMAWDLPTTSVGWFVWATTKVIVAAINVILFDSFMKQGKVNVKDTDNYIKANEILMKSKKHAEDIPKSPKAFLGGAYGKKGTTIFLSSGLSLVAFTQAIIQYQWATMLGYIFTIVMGIVFGILQMKKSEAYWGEEYLCYALMIQEKEKENEVNDN